jgi:hypothetical protein
MVILLVVIDGYSINGHYWLLYWWFDALPSHGVKPT